MKFKERLNQIKTYINIEEELKTKNSELAELEIKLSEIEIKLETRKSELEKTKNKISQNKSELESLKTEIIELKDFINSKFKQEFNKYDYRVDITNCYIISLNGKKYITTKEHNTKLTDLSNLAYGIFKVEIYTYYDVLNVTDNQYKYLHDYNYAHFDNTSFATKITGVKPDYEKHILEVYPELKLFTDNLVPNTYLKKIYYEINDLGSNKLIKKNSCK